MDAISVGLILDQEKEFEKLNKKIDLILNFLEDSINNESANIEKFKKLKGEIEK